MYQNNGVRERAERRRRGTMEVAEGERLRSWEGRRRGLTVLTTNSAFGLVACPNGKQTTLYRGDLTTEVTTCYAYNIL
jgi:hypothetical protein